MNKGISTWAIIVLLILVAIFISIATFYFLQNGMVNPLNIGSKEVTINGVLKYGNLLTPKHNYCADGKYIESADGSLITGNDTSLLVKVLASSTFTSQDLFTNVNKVANLTGKIYKGNNCAVKNSCECDDFIYIDSGGIDAVKSDEYASSLPTYTGAIKCYFPSDQCTPVLTTSVGKKYQLVDVRGAFDLNEGATLKVWAVFDPDPVELAGQPIDGSLYVAKVGTP